MRNFYIFLIIIFIILGYFVMKFAQNTLNKFDYMDKLNHEDDDIETD